MIDLWRTQPVFQRRRFFQGRRIRGSDIKDISWLDTAGNEMSDDAWAAGAVRSLGIRLAGDLIGDLDERGEPVVGETVLLLLNAQDEPASFALPATKAGQCWERLLDTNDSGIEAAVLNGDPYSLAARSMAMLRTVVRAPAADQNELASEVAPNRIPVEPPIIATAQ